MWHCLVAPAVTRYIVMKCDPKNKLTSEREMKYCSLIGKLLHLMWSIRPERHNEVEELSCHMTIASELHYKAMITTMNYCVGTRNHGLFHTSTWNWDEKDETFEFVVHSQSDFDYANNPKIGGVSWAQ